MSGNVTISEAPTTGLGRLITENRFFVPTHQRDYRWDRDRVERFFDDLTEAMDRGDSFYFIGLMVFMGPENGCLRVLDGQQRLATTLIIYAAIRGWFALSNDPEASKLQYDFIGRSDYGEAASQPKLSLNLNNDDYFQQYVTTGDHIETIRAKLKSTGKNDSNFLLLDAIVYCNQKILEKSAQLGDAAKTKAYLSALIKFMRDSVIVVRLTVPNESNAFRVFETLNDRGMDLSAVDLLKNYLFGCVYSDTPNKLKQIEHRWSQLTSVLQNSRHEDFLKVYWTSRHGLVLLDDIFEAVKKKYKTGPQAEALSKDLLEAAYHYAALDEPDDPVWAECSDKCRLLIADLKILGSKLVRPAILSGLKKLTAKEFESLLWLLEVISVRWQLIGEGRTGTIERLCARLAEQIWNGAVKKKAEALSCIKELYVEDKSFRESFSVQENLANKKAVFLLKKIEEAERAKNKGAVAKELSPHKSLTLEHILPENPSGEWSEVLKSDLKIVEECSSKLGNLCLLTQAGNKDLANKGFIKKRPLYASSELLTTQQVATHTAWNRESIGQHQDWLASRAVQIWKV